MCAFLLFNLATSRRKGAPIIGATGDSETHHLCQLLLGDHCNVVVSFNDVLAAVFLELSGEFPKAALPPLSVISDPAPPGKDTRLSLLPMFTRGWNVQGLLVSKPYKSVNLNYLQQAYF